MLLRTLSILLLPLALGACGESPKPQEESQGKLFQTQRQALDKAKQLQQQIESGELGTKRRIDDVVDGQ